MAIIAIDGPAGAGKSSVSREVAKRLGFQYLDTGAMYRCVALAATRRHIDFSDTDGLETLLRGLRIEFRGESVYLNGEEVTKKIRTPEMDKLSSDISKIGVVRERLTILQREMGRKGNIVAEGRDMGTVVFPDAELKIFLTAAPEERARRRWSQLQRAGKEVDFQQLVREIETRDRADSTRPIAPLKKASDAIELDTTSLSWDETVEEVLKLVKRYIPQPENPTT